MGYSKGRLMDGQMEINVWAKWKRQTGLWWDPVTYSVNAQPDGCQKCTSIPGRAPDTGGAIVPLLIISLVFNTRQMTRYEGKKFWAWTQFVEVTMKWVMTVWRNSFSQEMACYCRSLKCRGSEIEHQRPGFSFSAGTSWWEKAGCGPNV